MDIGALVKSFIYLVSSALLYPTLFLLAFLVLWTLVLTGSMAAEWLSRPRRPILEASELDRLMRVEASRSACSYHVRAYRALMLDLLNQPKGLSEPLIEFLLQEKSAELWKSLDHVRMLVRIGPGLGLIGTLIPMGTGLAALSQGDITKLSSDLVIAFTTTVVGLAVGLTAYCFYWKKKRWIEHDIRQMELLAEGMIDTIAKQEFSHEVHVKTQAFSGR